ncbi:MAG TPA: hypothetical protein DCM86_14970, partial [Verrucomicrobiales bacterium]|nr:hypothetical protein [Verrucomicrobiales bacterium]
MDIIFDCPHCEQELSIDAAGAGSQIDCPACGKSVRVPARGKEAAAPAAAPSPAPAPAAPAPSPTPAAAVAPPPAGKVMNAMATSAGAKEHKHFSVPVHEGPVESLIEKPLPTL